MGLLCLCAGLFRLQLLARYCGEKAELAEPTGGEPGQRGPAAHHTMQVTGPCPGLWIREHKWVGRLHSQWAGEVVTLSRWAMSQDGGGGTQSRQADFTGPAQESHLKTHKLIDSHNHEGKLGSRVITHNVQHSTKNNMTGKELGKCDPHQGATQLTETTTEHPQMLG